MVNRKDNILNRRLFDAFDINRDGYINFREFLKFLSTFVTGSEQDQYDLTFKIFANEYNNLIEKEFIKRIIKESISADPNLGRYIDEWTIDEIVSRTFGEAVAMNKIQYVQMLKQFSWILQWFKCDIEKITNINKVNSRKGSCFSV
jgi:Ca2+-binding EF-hand superfamily protein